MGEEWKRGNRPRGEGYRESETRAENVTGIANKVAKRDSIKEAYRFWSLRILDRHKDMQVYWYEVQQIKKHLENCSEMAKTNGIRRAKEHFEKVQKEMDSGLRCDTRPTGGPKPPHPHNPPSNYEDRMFKYDPSAIHRVTLLH